MPRDAILRAPPHLFEAEQAVLGCILDANQTYHRVAQFLRAEHFMDDRHGRIYETTARLIEAGEPVDALTLMDYFTRDDTLDAIGGTRYLIKLQACQALPSHAENYGRVVYDRAMRRAIIEKSQHAIERAHTIELDDSAAQIAASTAAELEALAPAIDTASASFDAVTDDTIEWIEAAAKRDQSILGLSTGIAALDHFIGGMHGGEVIIVAGRPSMGKTDLACSIAINVAKNGKRVAIFQCDMSRRLLTLRFIARETGIPASVMRAGETTESGFGRIIDARDRLRALALLIDDAGEQWVSSIRARCQRFKPDFVVIDYIQLLEGAVPGERYEGDVQRVTRISKAIKQAAKALGVPVMALSQLNRSVESRTDKEPQLSDLRESGAIEQDADVVMLLFNEAYYLVRAAEKEQKTDAWRAAMDRVKNTAEVIVAKQRSGPVGRVRLHYEPARSFFGDLKSNDSLSQETML